LTLDGPVGVTGDSHGSFSLAVEEGGVFSEDELPLASTVDFDGEDGVITLEVAGSISTDTETDETIGGYVVDVV